MDRVLDVISECGGAVQIALDLLDLREAGAIAASLPSSRALILEAGTPLIKAWGGTAIKLIRSIRPEAVLVADTKTADAARIEAEVVKSSGADAFTVLAYAGDEVLRSASEAARSMALSVYGDTIWTDPRVSARRLKEAGIPVALVHIGVDAQARGVRASSLMSMISELRDSFGGPIAIAGGLKPGDVEEAIRAGASIVIIGSAVVRAESPRREAERALEALARVGVRCR